jgi:hypothetical protein
LKSSIPQKGWEVARHGTLNAEDALKVAHTEIFEAAQRQTRDFA